MRWGNSIRSSSTGNRGWRSHDQLIIPTNTPDLGVRLTFLKLYKHAGEDFRRAGVDARRCNWLEAYRRGYLWQTMGLLT